MDEYVIPIFLAALAGMTLTLGAWFVRALTRSAATTMFGTFTRDENPVGYWFWAIYHVAGLVSVVLVLVAVLIAFITGAA